MGKLIELLNEKAIVDGKYFKNYSQPINLYRLLFTTMQDDMPKSLTGAVIDRMLQGFDDKVINKLKNSFNAIKRGIKNKKPAKELRKVRTDFYTIIFDLLEEHATNIPDYNKAKFVRHFKYRTEREIIEQSLIMLRIGKGLIKTNDLSPMDKKVIKEIITSINPSDEIATNMEVSDTKTDSITPTQTNQPSQETQLDRLRQVSDSELQVKLSNNTNSVRDMVGEDEKNTSEAVEQKKNDLIENNFNNEIETIVNNMRDRGYNEDAIKRVNLVLKKINSNLLELKQKNDKIGDKDIMMVSKMASEFLEIAIDDFEIFLKNGKMETLTLACELLPYDNDTIHLSLQTSDGIDAEDKVKYERDFKLGFNGGIETVSHKTFQVPSESQGKGTAKKIFEKSLNLYEAHGIKRIDVQANISIGGYAWFRYGFIPNDMAQVHSSDPDETTISNWLYHVWADSINSLEYSVVKNEVRPGLADHFKKNGANAAFIKDLLEVKDYKSWALSVGQAMKDEFIKVYNTIDDVKNLSKDMVVEKFEINVNGKKYKIPYHAMFKIQGVKDSTKSAIIPTDFVAMNWYGHLKLDDAKQMKIARDYCHTRK